MCTVTIVQITDTAEDSILNGAARSLRIRLACNRDELRSRPAALSPIVRRFGARDAIMPVDPVSDGTWIAVNDAGLAATLLNVNMKLERGGQHERATSSRGLLVPQLMACSTFEDAHRIAASFDARGYPPFRLVLIDRRNIAQFYSDGRTPRHERSPLGTRPLMFTSSGLGDALVEGPRRELFDSMFTAAAEPAAQQFAFHRHSWPDRRHLSVCMERDEARTVSHTVIDLEPGRVALTYLPGAPDRTEPLAPLTLPIRGEHA